MTGVISTFVLLVSTTVSCFAENQLSVVEFNEGTFEILSTAKLPASIRDELSAVASKNIPKIQNLHDTAALLKFYDLGEDVKILGFDGKVHGPIKIGTFAIVFKKKGDCSNYPDLFLKGSYIDNLSEVSGIALPVSATAISDPNEIKNLSTSVSRAMPGLLGKDLQSQGKGIVDSTSYFHYRAKVYAISPGVLVGGYLGEINQGKYRKIADLKLPNCGS